MTHSVKVYEAACRGCVNCIKSCPTEAIRVIDGLIRILPDLCIDCGECLRICTKKAIRLDEDDWGVLRSHVPLTVMADPTFYAQFGAYWHPAMVLAALADWGVDLLFEEAALAFDACAASSARILDTASQEQLPFISTYCPAVVRLIQMRFPELLGRLIPVENPLEVGAGLWRRVKGAGDLVLFSPCPAKVSMARNPLGREKSEISHVVSIRSVARNLLAAGARVSEEVPEPENRRWLTWALRGGESRHIRAFSKKDLKTIAVSGLRNTLDLLQELELGRFAGLDFVECRVCDLGCIGGVGNIESRFLASLRLAKLKTDWEIPDEEREAATAEQIQLLCRLEKPIPPKPILPLSDNLTEAMEKLKRMKEIYENLPHIDCGSCGRPSCEAMAMDIVRGEGEVTDCIFKLREEISQLAEEILSLSKTVPHTLKGRR